MKIKTLAVLAISMTLTLAFSQAQETAPAAATSGADQPLPAKTYFPPALHAAFDLFSQGKPDRALAELNNLKSSKAGRKTADSLFFMEGLIYKRQNRPDRAAASFKNSLYYRGSNSDVLYHLALCETDLNKSEEALRRMKEALWFGRFTAVKREDAFLQLGLMYEHGQDKTAAEKAFRGALQANPDYLPAKAKLADLLSREGDQDAAIALLRQAVSKDPQDEALKVKLAGALLTGADRSVNKRDLAYALELTTAAAAKKTPEELPKDPVFAVHVRALLANEKIAEAESLLQKALIKTPSDPQLLLLKRQLEIEKTAAAKGSSSSSSSAASGR